MKAQRGGTLIGLVIGLVVGLGVALAVALYVSKVPVPFIDKLPQRTAHPGRAGFTKGARAAPFPSRRAALAVPPDPNQ